MIVCTCDACGRVVDNWSTLRVELNGMNSNLNEHREICPDCQKEVKNKAIAFLDSITVTNSNDE